MKKKKKKKIYKKKKKKMKEWLNFEEKKKSFSYFSITIK